MTESILEIIHRLEREDVTDEFVEYMRRNPPDEEEVKKLAYIKWKNRQRYPNNVNSKEEELRDFTQAKVDLTLIPIRKEG